MKKKSFFIFHNRKALRTDMSDRNLEFWTTSPNVFLVATTTNNLSNMPGKIVGIIAYKKIGPNTAELSRLTVDMDYRRMKIGQRLIQSLIDLAQENGFEEIYLETSAPYGFHSVRDAVCLYEKMNFQHLRTFKFGWPSSIFAWLTSLRVMSYIYRIQ